GRCRAGWEQRRQSRDAPALPDGVGPASVTERSTRGTSVTTSLKGSPAQTWWIRAGSGASRRCGRGTPDRAGGCLVGGHGEVLRGSRGDAAGAELGSFFVERIAVNTGTVRSCPASRSQRGGRGGSTVGRHGCAGADTRA